MTARWRLRSVLSLLACAVVLLVLSSPANAQSAKGSGRRAVFTKQSQAELSKLFSFALPSELNELRARQIDIQPHSATFQLVWSSQHVMTATLLLEQPCPARLRRLEAPFCLGFKHLAPFPVSVANAERVMADRVKARTSALHGTLGWAAAPSNRPKSAAPKSPGEREGPSDPSSSRNRGTWASILALLIVASLLFWWLGRRDGQRAIGNYDRVASVDSYKPILPLLAIYLVLALGSSWTLLHAPVVATAPCRALTTVALWLGSGWDWAAVVLRLVDLLAGGAAVAVVYRFGIELASRRAGLLAAAMLATNPWHSAGMGHAFGYSVVALCFILASRHLTLVATGQRANSVAGHAAPLAVATLWCPEVALLPAILLVLLAIWPKPNHPPRWAAGLALVTIAGALIPTAMLLTHHGLAGALGKLTLIRGGLRLDLLPILYATLAGAGMALPILAVGLLLPRLEAVRRLETLLVIGLSAALVLGALLGGGWWWGAPQFAVGAMLLGIYLDGLLSRAPHPARVALAVVLVANLFIAWRRTHEPRLPLSRSIAWLSAPCEYASWMSGPAQDASEQPEEELELSVVVPVYNEADGLEETVAKLRAWLHLEDPRGELILVDDGSTDDSRQLMERLAERCPALRTTGFAVNRGRGAALRLGMHAARGSIVLSTEADQSWGLECLSQLVALIRSGAADVALASPHRPDGRMVAVPMFRRLLSRGANLLTRRVFGGSITMATGMTRAYRRDALGQILSERDGKEFHLDTLCRAVRRGLTIEEVSATLSWQQGRAQRQSWGGPLRLAASVSKHLAVLGVHVQRTVGR